MVTNELLSRLLNYYGLKNMSALADKLEVSQSTISNWKSRNSIGAVFDVVNKNDPTFLNHLFSNLIIENNRIEGSKINVGIDNSKEGSKHYYNQPNIPEEVVDDIELLFKLARKYNKEKEVINNFDDFSYKQRKKIKNDTE